MNTIDARRFLRDYRIEFRDDMETGRTGWIHLDCPFCPGVPDHHLGYNTMKHFWNCWRCGGKTWKEVAKVLSGLSVHELTARYGSGESSPAWRERRPRKRTELLEARMPIACDLMRAPHRRYLESRNIAPQAVEQLWGLLGTGPVGPDKLRIIAPVAWRGRTVTWQGRDITGKSKAKYRACPKEDEARPIKHCLYGLEKTDPDAGCVVVEGIFDVWRLGPGAVCTFGTEWSVNQARLLLGMKRVFLLFDPDEESSRAFSELFCRLLSVGGVPQVEQLGLEDVDGRDPGDLSPEEAASLMAELRLAPCLRRPRL